jgi:hypothetical protein
MHKTRTQQINRSSIYQAFASSSSLNRAFYSPMNLIQS